MIQAVEVSEVGRRGAVGSGRAGSAVAVERAAAGATSGAADGAPGAGAASKPTIGGASSAATSATPDAILADLQRRLAAPQRHRLLHGYPMRPLMRTAHLDHGLEDVCIDRERQLIVGVIPHPFCNPRVEGCGFCTFAHERYRRGAEERVVHAVIEEIRARLERTPGLRDRAAAALYFGGGTANLTPPPVFARLGHALADAFDLAGAEVTLEGVPIYFLSRGAALLDALDAIPARQRRLSLGVQTFDAGWLERMGREAFGTREQIGEVVALAHARGMTTSCDLLIDLPGQSVEAMVEDVRTAHALGFDQICVYHLVLHEGLGTAWSRDPALLAALPSNAVAFEHWRTVRAWLLEHGYVQSTLTNFERAEVAGTPRAFVYEPLSFQPERTDAVGFGPGGISTFTDLPGRRALKLVNAEGADGYMIQIDDHGQAPALAFRYAAKDLRLLHMTRTLPRGGVDRAAYRESFASDLFSDFPLEVAALAAEGLVEVDATRLGLTERGMFFADSVAGLLASRRVDDLRERRRLEAEEAGRALDDAAASHMG